MQLKYYFNALENNMPIDIIAIYIKDILEDLGSITGEIITECQCTQSYIDYLANKNKMYRKRQVIKLLKSGENPEKIRVFGHFIDIRTLLY